MNQDPARTEEGTCPVCNGTGKQPGTNLVCNYCGGRGTHG
jgi:DnaJ-class molecular chaperone